MAERQTIELQVNINAVAAPAQEAATVCKEVVDFYFGSLEKADLSKKPEGLEEAKFHKIGFSGPELTAEQRRAIHETWILSKAFQDLMRGLRASLEEAYFVSELLATGKFSAKSNATIEELLAPFKKRATGLNFPDLLNAVNSRLEKPLEFSEAYRSMQDARNCLEHRNGIVGQADAKTDGKMVLRFPRLIAFIDRNGEQIEIYAGMEVQAGEGIMIKIDVQRREFLQGQRLSISAADFDQICFACSQFAAELAANLSKKLAPATSAS
jgi:hypothetical protein